MCADRSTLRRGVLLFLVVICALGALVGWWVLHRYGAELREVLDWILKEIHSVGPVGFFGLMAVLPAIGVPLSFFTLTAGSVFGSSMGMATVIGLSSLSILINLGLSYVLGRWVLRPWIAKLCDWLGYRLPVIPSSDQLGLVLLVRVTPGTPYVLQSYLLGMATIPFRLYMLVSWSIATLYAVAFILFGEALVAGRGRGIILGLSTLVALTVIVKMLRKKFSAKVSGEDVA